MGAGQDGATLERQCPEACNSAADGHLASGDILPCHAHPPRSLFGHLHLPVVAAGEEALPPHHAIVVVEAAGVVLQLLLGGHLFVFIKAHCGAAARESEERMGSVRVKGQGCDICD